MVRAVVLVRSPKKLIAAKLGRLDFVVDAFPTSGQFDAVAVINVSDLSQIRNAAYHIQSISGVERTETMIEAQ